MDLLFYQIGVPNQPSQSIPKVGIWKFGHSYGFYDLEDCDDDGILRLSTKIAAHFDIDGNLINIYIGKLFTTNKGTIIQWLDKDKDYQVFRKYLFEDASTRARMAGNVIVLALKNLNANEDKMMREHPATTYFVPLFFPQGAQGMNIKQLRHGAVFRTGGVSIDSIEFRVLSDEPGIKNNDLILKGVTKIEFTKNNKIIKVQHHVSVANGHIFDVDVTAFFKNVIRGHSKMGDPLIGVDVLPSVYSIWDVMNASVRHPHRSERWRWFVKRIPADLRARFEDRDARQFAVFIPRGLSEKEQEAVNVLDYVVEFENLEFAHNYLFLRNPKADREAGAFRRDTIRGTPKITTLGCIDMTVTLFKEKIFVARDHYPVIVPGYSILFGLFSTYHSIRELVIRGRNQIVLARQRGMGRNGIVYEINEPIS